MSNFPAVMNVNDLSSALADSKVQEAPGSNAGVNFLKMDFESGEWSMGKDAEDVTGEDILVNTATITHGWILWSGGRPKKSMVPFNQDLPMAPDSIGDDYPSEGRGLQGALMDDQSPVAFDTNSFGGRKGVDNLLGSIKAKAATGSQFLYPQVKLGSESYANAKRGGKLVYNPIFEVVAWCNQDGVDEEGEAPQIEAAPEAEQPAKRQSRRSRNK